jgi:hypothetical protein
VKDEGMAMGELRSLLRRQNAAVLAGWKS